MSIPFDITFHPSWWHKHAKINFTREFFELPAYRLEADQKMRKTLHQFFGNYGIGEQFPEIRPIIGSDLLACGFLHSELLGCPVTYTEADAPQVQCRELSLADAIEASAIDLDNHPLWLNYLGQMQMLNDQVGGVIPAVNLMGVQNIAFDLIGSELYTAYYEEPEQVHKLLQNITTLIEKIGLRLQKESKALSGGVTAIVNKTLPEQYLTSNCTVDLISKDFYEEFLLPYDNHLAETFGAFGIHHCGGHMERFATSYGKVKNLVFAEVGAGSDAGAVRKALPDIHLNLRYSPVKLKTATLSEIKEELEQLLKATGGAQSISCVGIDGETTPEQVTIFLEVCKALSKKY